MLLFIDTCQCHEFGSNGVLCDPVTFQCDCKPGVFGRTCDKCQLGWWGLRLIKEENNIGCLPCQCNELGSARDDCEQNTGRCLCKEGVVGVKCDGCPEEGQILTANGCITDEGLLHKESCDTKDCGNGQCILDGNMAAVCTCDYDCPDNIEYVCGSNGQTYLSLCHLKKSACVNSIEIRKVGSGECPETTTQRTSTTTTADGADKGRSSQPLASGVVKCEDNPCDNGGTCVSDSQKGFRCLCSVFWTGEKCTEVNIFNAPHFSGESFIKLAGWSNPSTSFDLELRIIPTKLSGVLLYAGKLTGKGDFMSLVLNDGILEFKFDNGHGSVVLRTKEKLLSNRQHIVRCQRNGRSGMLYVEGQDPVSGEAPGTLTRMEVDPILYIGHTSLRKEEISKRLSQNVGGMTSGFVGCVYMVHDAVSSLGFKLMSSEESMIIEGRDISQCTSDPCLEAPCANGGLCKMVDAFNYLCDCKAPYTGPNCAMKSKRIRHLIGKASGENSNELPQFTGTSYIQYRTKKELTLNSSFEISFLPTHHDGVLLFVSQQTDGSGDFLMLSLENLAPVLRYDLGTGLTSLSMQKNLVKLHAWNSLTLIRFGKGAWLSLNNNQPEFISAEGMMNYLNVDNLVTFGAIPPQVRRTKQYLSSSGFVGTIQRVTINGEGIDDFFGSAQLQSGVKVYKGPPCYPDPCKPGYTCVPSLADYKCEQI